jgi:hypothetical protein
MRRPAGLGSSPCDERRLRGRSGMVIGGTATAPAKAKLPGTSFASRSIFFGASMEEWSRNSHSLRARVRKVGQGSSGAGGHGGRLSPSSL